MKNGHEIQYVESLKQRFPYMFADPVISLGFYKGWFPDFVRLCFELDALLGEERRRFSWAQLKEKFGSYRMHFNFQLPPIPPGSGDGDDAGDDEDGQSEDDEQQGDERVALTALREQIHSTIQRHAAAMDTKCCVCGDPGTKTTDKPWINTLCKFHSDDARHARGDNQPLYELFAVPKWPGDGAGGGAP